MCVASRSRVIDTLFYRLHRLQVLIGVRQGSPMARFKRARKDDQSDCSVDSETVLLPLPEDLDVQTAPNLDLFDVFNAKTSRAITRAHC